jgi:probable rRNA maturation factor
LTVAITLVDSRFKIDKKRIVSLISKVMRDEASGGRAVDIIYCRDRDITPLNLKFKGKNRSTDVLAFDLHDGKYLGEVYVNLEIARRQAIENKVSYIEEVNRLTIHGVLHLLGYRDNTPANKTKMWARQESYLK